MYNFIPVPPETVTVEKQKLNQAIELVGSLPCTTLRCKHATAKGWLLCGRCRALEIMHELMGP